MPDRARIPRQRPLALGGEPAGGVETRLQAGELLVERALARQAHRLDIELELAAGFVDRRRGPHFDLLAVLERELRVLRLVPEEYAAHLRLRVLEVEVAMTGRCPGEVRNLPGHPDETQMALDEQARRAHEQRHRQDDGASHRRRQRLAARRRRGPGGVGRAVSGGCARRLQYGIGSDRRWTNWAGMSVLSWTICRFKIVPLPTADACGRPATGLMVSGSAIVID